MGLRKKISPVKLILLLSSSMTVMAGAIIAPSLPEISRHFEGHENSEVLSRLVLTLPALMIAIAAPFAGWFLDRFGRIKILSGALALYALAGTTGFYLNDLYHILIGRAVLGIAVGGVMTACTTLIGDYFEGDERNRFLGTQAAFMALGGTVYIVLAGFLADQSWRYPFLLYAFALVLLPLAYYFLWEPTQEQGTAPVDTSSTNTFRISTIVLIYAIALLGMLVFYMIPVQIPYLLDKITHSNNTLIGAAIAVATAFAALASMRFGKLKQSLDHYAVFALSFLLMSGGYLIIFFSEVYWQILLGLVVSGLGAGLLMPNANLWAVSIAPLQERGRWIGGLTTAVFLGQFLSPILLEPLRKATSLNIAFGIVAGGLLLMATVLGVTSRWKQKQSATRLKEKVL